MPGIYIYLCPIVSLHGAVEIRPSTLSLSLISLVCCRPLLARLVPGRILLGKYPGQIPSDLPVDRQNARDRVREIVLRGGATDLLSLQVGAIHLTVAGRA